MDEFARHLVERIVKDTDFLLSTGSVTWGVARVGIIRMMADLDHRNPDCAAEIRDAIQPYIIWNDIPARPKALPGFNNAQQACFGRESAMIVENKRRHQRIVPIVREAKMRLPDGSEEVVNILNVSVSGVGIQTSARPEFGSEVMIGATRIMIVRHFADGVAGQFRRPLRPDALRETMRL